MPLKPVRWGKKVHCLSGADDVMYDFVIYLGKIEPLSDKSNLGASSNVEVNLAEIIPNDANHLLYLAGGLSLFLFKFTWQGKALLFRGS